MSILERCEQRALTRLKYPEMLPGGLERARKWEVEVSALITLEKCGGSEKCVCVQGRGVLERPRCKPDSLWNEIKWEMAEKGSKLLR